jgi:diguanylate cyclase (GGDEF)-like protein
MGGRGSFWFCVPGALLAGARSRPRAAVVAAATVVAAALLASLATSGGPPAPASAILVPAASVAILTSVRRRLETERDAMRTSALTDPLTGAANRRSIDQRIEYEIVRHTRSNRSFAVLMLDLDGFKAINDTYGHPAGDALLCNVAAALTEAVRDQDTVARIGGDEFCVLAPETDAAGAPRLAARAQSAVARVTAGNDGLGAGAGLAVFPADGVTVAALLAAADRRLLAAKRARRAAGNERRAA